MAVPPPASYWKGRPQRRTWRTRHDHSWLWSRTEAHSNDTWWKTKKNRMKHMDKHFWTTRALCVSFQPARVAIHPAHSAPVIDGAYAQFYRVPSIELLARDCLTLDGTALSTKYSSELRSARGFISNKLEHEYMKKKMPEWLNLLRTATPPMRSWTAP